MIKCHQEVQPELLALQDLQRQQQWQRRRRTGGFCGCRSCWVDSSAEPNQQPSARTPTSDVAKPTLTKVKFVVIAVLALLKEAHFKRGMFNSFVPESNSGGITDLAGGAQRPPAADPTGLIGGVRPPPTRHLFIITLLLCLPPASLLAEGGRSDADGRG